jgi:hypothetical protein
MKILPSTLSLIKVLFCVMYFFCVMGMQLYGGVERFQLKLLNVSLRAYGHALPRHFSEAQRV